jgi:DNA-binding XRE family transcriptional regulator
MKTKHLNGVITNRVTVKGKPMVLLDAAEFDRLKRKADEFEPKLPDVLPDGNYPAGEYLRVSLAIKIIRHRRRLGLSQAELARRAGIRLTTLTQLEQGQVDPSIRTVDKIDRALQAAEGKAAKA